MTRHLNLTAFNSPRFIEGFRGRDFFKSRCYIYLKYILEIMQSYDFTLILIAIQKNMYNQR